jgi:uncharacterized damage-inducible protein DinB
MSTKLLRLAFGMWLYVLSASIANAQTPAKATLTPAEREAAVKYLEETRAKVLDSVKDLSDEQWKFKPAADRWSVAEVAEHIAISDEFILGAVTNRLLKTPAAPEKKESVKGKEDLIQKSITNRTSKFQAPEMIKPTNRWATRDEVIKAFTANRAKTIEYVKTTQDDLRDHFMLHPAYKELDGLQWIYLLSGHSERHSLQILEVKADANFPKK